MSSDEDLEQWLKELKKPKADTINFSFPTDKLKTAYLSSIDKRSEDQVRDLIRKFLIPSGALGTDWSTLVWLMHLIRNKKLPRLWEFQRRLLLFAKAKKSRRAANGPWEGITWVLDLLPSNPRAALEALNAYFEAHAGFMPDGRIHGLFDAMELIRAKYIERPRSPERLHSSLA